ncbi:putative acid-sensing ion channel 2-like 1 [Homarus americanus]|uniref:Putative acid-sensing ion channel 2-like 1 n=1 Tax=Homarus americanus TaxID=6706 RepID=A0A8J5K6D8_HOMAM|nr:putative acid-sensing ion channel 2-like 1 [Homarus americanus]
MAAKADDDPPAYHTVYPGRSLTTKSTTPPRTEEEEGEEKVEKRLKEVKQESKTPKDIDVKKEDEESRLHRGCSRDDLTKTTRGIIKQASDMTQGAQDALVEFCNKTTAHGFNHIVKEEQHLLLRLFWLFVTMTGLVLLLSACYDVTYSALVTRRPSTQVIYHDLHSSEYNVSKTLASYLQLAIRGPDVANPWFDSRRREVLNDELDDYLKVNNLTLSEMVTLLSPSCEEVIVGCFSPRKDRYSNECCRDLFSPTITTLGLCYTTLTQGATLHLNQSITGLIGGHRILSC